MYNKPSRPSQSRNKVIRNDIELKSAVDKISNNFDLSFICRAVLLEVVSRFKKGEDLTQAVRYESQTSYAEAIRCSVKTIGRAESVLHVAGILVKKTGRHPNNPFRRTRFLKLGPQFYLALTVMKTAQNPKKPNDMRNGHSVPTGMVTESEELIRNKVNTHNNIGNTPERPIMTDDRPKPKKETEAVSNRKKINSKSLIEDLCKPTKKKVPSRTCDITDEIFQSASWIPVDRLNLEIQRLVVMRGHKQVREDLQKIFHGKPIVERLELSGRVFRLLEESYVNLNKRS